MLKYGLAALAAAALTTLSAVTLVGSADAGAPCKRKKFETTLVADACKAGGQAKAKDAMKKWMKEAKKKHPTVGCATCHTKVAGDYPLKPDGMKLFKEMGGK